MNKYNENKVPLFSVIELTVISITMFILGICLGITITIGGLI